MLFSDSSHIRACFCKRSWCTSIQKYKTKLYFFLYIDHLWPQMATETPNVAQLHAHCNLQPAIMAILGSFWRYPSWAHLTAFPEENLLEPVLSRDSQVTIRGIALTPLVAAWPPFRFPFFPLSLTFPLHASSPHHCLLRFLSLHGRAGFVCLSLLPTFTFVDHFHIFRLTAARL